MSRRPLIAKRRGAGQLHFDVLLRLPCSVLEHLDRAAAENYRTRTAEVLARLEASIESESSIRHTRIVNPIAFAGKVVGDASQQGQ